MHGKGSFLLTIQLEADPNAAEAARIGVGEYSEGKSQGIANKPTAKKKLNKKSIVAATIPVPLNETDVVPASTAMHEAWPITAKSISFRLPKRSTTQIGMSDERKYAMPLNPDKRSEISRERPTDCSKITSFEAETL